MSLRHPPYLRGQATKTFGNWVKEPDCSWPHALNDPINFVIEAGYSETQSRLRLDAQGWLELPVSDASNLRKQQFIVSTRIRSYQAR